MLVVAVEECQLMSLAGTTTQKLLCMVRHHFVHLAWLALLSFLVNVLEQLYLQLND